MVAGSTTTPAYHRPPHCRGGLFLVLPFVQIRSDLLGRFRRVETVHAGGLDQRHSCAPLLFVRNHVAIWTGCCGMPPQDKRDRSMAIDNCDASMIDRHAKYVRVSGFAEQGAYNAAVDEAIQTVGVRADVFGVEPALMESDVRDLRRNLRRIRWRFLLRRVWLLFSN